ncbi:MAG: ARPP-1 family domain-containing protein [Actinomycetes bacterium]
MTIDLLEKVTVGEPQTVAGITLFPIFGTEAVPAPIGLAGDRIEITEKDAAEVPTLVATNPTNAPVLLVEGEVVDGGRQTRTLNVSVLVPANSSVEVPVSCVEAGRWRGGREFSRSGKYASREVRASKTRGVNRNVRRGRGVKSSDQGAVWGAVDSELLRFQTSHPSSAWDAVHVAAYELPDDELAPDPEATAAEVSAETAYQKARRARLDAVAALVDQGPLAQQSGVVVAVGDQVVSAEVFASPELLAARWEDIVRGILLDGGEERDTTVDRAAAEKFLQDLTAADQVLTPGVGLGEDCHIESTDVVGQALIWGDSLIHASAFATR